MGQTRRRTRSATVDRAAAADVSYLLSTYTYIYQASYSGEVDTPHVSPSRWPTVGSVGGINGLQMAMCMNCIPAAPKGNSAAPVAYYSLNAD